MKKIGFLLLCTVLQSMAQDVVYETELLKITEIKPNVFVHVSYLQTEDFGKVGCNGLVIVDHKKAIVFDTPIDDPSSQELIDWLTKEKSVEIKAVVATHFHDDCLGGVQAFEEAGIPSYASAFTQSLAEKEGNAVPKNAFAKDKKFKVGKKKVYVRFFGAGHTLDNVVAYEPKDRLLFGGCLVKTLNAGKGYLGDADVKEWPLTIQKIENAYPEVDLVVPGHGDYGDKKLLVFTRKLFSE
ncbi:subclass B1 metallo-beta-lactamase [Marinilongibacter aquaticus]|uniref:subclass B1 metallo-beta-lactamase n=1 Tax=Marinilongibacter aquaticus TaxID=2975157 RepID=UPI0021BDD814|nr:subclass B1 metallo-beta-lactamase [Marinilongibacter aquaticus]UBM59175.1 subclass B1 metallo-beta-lactamase [Marinilongibacter aquaticus]